MGREPGVDVEGADEEVGRRALASQYGLTEAQDDRFRSKASAWRGLMRALLDHGQFGNVRARVPPHVQRWMDKPPLGSSWMPALTFQPVFAALESLIDEEELFEVAHDSIITGPLKVMAPLVEGTLRLFGADPNAFFKRVPKIMSQQLEGVTFAYAAPDPRRAVVRVTYDYIEHPVRYAFLYWEGTLSVSIGICRKNVLERGTEINGNTAEIRFHWE